MKLIILLPILIALFSNCTVRTLYLSFTDHINMTGKPTSTWEKRESETLVKNSIGSLILKNAKLKSLLIIKNDTVMFEWYKKGYYESTAHNLKSATKTIVSLLTGIAVDKGFLSLETNLKSLFPNVGMDPLTGKVTIRDLLTMQGGFPYDDSYYWLVCSSLNPVKSTLNKRRKINPGEISEYSDVSANLLGYAVAKATNQKLEEFADKNLFSPIGIGFNVWANDLKGNNATAGDLFLCSRDLAKIGYLMLREGNFNGQQIISKSWVQESISKQTILKAFPCNLEYGFLWWLDNNYNPGAFCAIGYGGQILYVSPLDNTIIVTTSMFGSSGWPAVLETIREIIKLTK